MYKQKKKKEVVNGISNSDNSGVLRNKYGTGVRSYLVNSGFSNNDIGYKNGMVTYRGEEVLQPNVVVDGRSYADEDSLRELALDLHSRNGADLVSATDYAAEATGLKNAASVNNGYVSVGDKTMKASVSSDGVAYLPREAMDEALSEYKNKIGYRSENDIYNDWKNTDGAKVKKALLEIIESDWEYNPEKDPAYKAYADMYEREGKRAYADAFGNAIAGTDGQVNSMAITTAAKGMDYYMQKLSDKIPELMEADFQRFNSMQDKRLKAVGEIMDIYDREYSANSDYLERLNEANMQNYDSKIYADESELEERYLENKIFNGYIDSEKALTELEYMPKVYDSELESERLSQEMDKTGIEGEKLSQAIDAIELEYKPKLYDAELYLLTLKKAMEELELHYQPKMYDAELSEIEKENVLRDLEAEFFTSRYWR